MKLSRDMSNQILSTTLFRNLEVRSYTLLSTWQPHAVSINGPILLLRGALTCYHRDFCNTACVTFHWDWLLTWVTSTLTPLSTLTSFVNIRTFILFDDSVLRIKKKTRQRMPRTSIFLLRGLESGPVTESSRFLQYFMRHDWISFSLTSKSLMPFALPTEGCKFPLVSLRKLILAHISGHITPIKGGGHCQAREICSWDAWRGTS